MKRDLPSIRNNLRGLIHEEHIPSMGVRDMYIHQTIYLLFLFIRHHFIISDVMSYYVIYSLYVHIHFSMYPFHTSWVFIHPSLVYLFHSTLFVCSLFSTLSKTVLEFFATSSSLYKVLMKVHQRPKSPNIHPTPCHVTVWETHDMNVPIRRDEGEDTGRN